MHALFPILAAVLQAGSLTLDKLALSLRGVSFRTYTGVSFPLSFAVTFGIFLVLRPPLAADLFAGKLLIFIVGSVILGILGNYLFYRALDSDGLGEIQTLDLLHNVPIILVSSVVFADERNFFVLVPALAASLAVIWSHWKRRHFVIAKKTAPFVLWALVSAPVAAILTKTLLQVWHPVSLELVRTGAMAMVFAPLFSRQAKNASPKAFLFLLATNALTTVAWILFFFSYQRSGIVYTLLLFSLQPLLVYGAALLFLKEKLEWKKLAAFAVVLGSIAAAQWLA